MGIVCLFAKAPKPGMVKTRLAGKWGSDTAAALARAFLTDSWAALQALDHVHPVLASVGDLSDVIAAAPSDVWPQGTGDLGERLERILGRALQTAPFAIALGADSPGLPLRLVERACVSLRAGTDAVFGPADDGGFYLLGLRRCPTGLLSGIPWSQSDTLAHAVARCADCGLQTSLLDSWFDVDHPEDLLRLRTMLEEGEIAAPATANVLARLFT
jgi:rSAM/selenodomain-associated transferase 1